MLLVENSIEAAIELLPEGIRRDETAVRATIENNIRRLIVDRSEINPRYYEEMSRLLDKLIQQQKEGRQIIENICRGLPTSAGQ